MQPTQHQFSFQNNQQRYNQKRSGSVAKKMPISSANDNQQQSKKLLNQEGYFSNQQYHNYLQNARYKPTFEKAYQPENVHCTQNRIQTNSVKLDKINPRIKSLQHSFQQQIHSNQNYNSKRNSNTERLMTANVDSRNQLENYQQKQEHRGKMVEAFPAIQKDIKDLKSIYSSQNEKSKLQLKYLARNTPLFRKIYKNRNNPNFQTNESQFRKITFTPQSTTYIKHDKDLKLDQHMITSQSEYMNQYHKMQTQKNAMQIKNNGYQSEQNEQQFQQSQCQSMAKNQLSKLVHGPLKIQMQNSVYLKKRHDKNSAELKNTPQIQSNTCNNFYQNETKNEQLNIQPIQSQEYQQQEDINNHKDANQQQIIAEGEILVESKSGNTLQLPVQQQQSKYVSLSYDKVFNSDEDECPQQQQQAIISCAHSHTQCQQEQNEQNQILHNDDKSSILSGISFKSRYSSYLNHLQGNCLCNCVCGKCLCEFRNKPTTQMYDLHQTCQTSYQKDTQFASQKLLQTAKNYVIYEKQPVLSHEKPITFFSTTSSTDLFNPKQDKDDKLSKTIDESQCGFKIKDSSKQDIFSYVPQYQAMSRTSYNDQFPKNQGTNLKELAMIQAELNGGGKIKTLNEMSLVPLRFVNQSTYHKNYMNLQTGINFQSVVYLKNKMQNYKQKNPIELVDYTHAQDSASHSQFQYAKYQAPIEQDPHYTTINKYPSFANQYTTMNMVKYTKFPNKSYQKCK